MTLFHARCCVVACEEGKLDLSLRDSRVGGSDDVGEVRDPEIRDLGGLADGQLVRGYVKAVTDIGAYVR